MNEMPYSLWDEIVEVIGSDATLKLFKEWGGSRISIPAHAPEGHQLVNLLGREGADALCEYYRQGTAAGGFRGAVLDLPRGPTGTMVATVIPLLQAARQIMADALASGKSADEAARLSGLTRRTGYRMLKRLRQAKASRTAASQKSQGQSC